MVNESVAVVGAGVSGLTAAYLLTRRYAVTVFDKNVHLGGNADTQVATLPDGSTVPVDVAFMAYGAHTYPFFQQLLTELEVESVPADVAVDISCTSCGFTHNARRRARGLTAPPQPAGMNSELWQRFLGELTRFPNDVKEIVEARGRDKRSVGEFLLDNDYSDYFFAHFVYPRVAPWFLSDPDSARLTSMEFLADTLRRYGVLDSEIVAGWRAVKGGSRVYVERITSRLTAVSTGVAVTAVDRSASGVVITDEWGGSHNFDRAVMAVPPAVALRLLGTGATARERELLGTFEYTSMNVCLHTDASVIPDVPDGSSIQMRIACADLGGTFRGCTINAAQLQGLGTDVTVVASYNPSGEIDPTAVSSWTSYTHPVFTVEAYEAQRHLAELSTGRIAFAGAYFGGGVHEDGCRSGVEAAASLGVTWSGPKS